MSAIAPLAGGFKGALVKKPWDYKVCAAIPHLDTLEPLRALIALLRTQSVPPYILVVDTGSPETVCKKMEKVLRADDLEIHYIRAHGYSHPSEPVTVALDLAQSICRSQYLFHTHADCFLTNRCFLEKQMQLCNAQNPVIGYRMSPRDWATDEWQWMVSHTATLLYMPAIHRAGATWSYQRIHALGYDSKKFAGWPDTETAFNHGIRDAGIVPTLIGDERNHERQTDKNVDHCRSYAGSKLYSETYHAQASVWMESALSEARRRAHEWRAMNLAQSAKVKYPRKKALCTVAP